MEELEIIKARVGSTYNLKTGDVLYNLEFKAKGHFLFNGYCFDFYSSIEEANLALKRFSDGLDVYEQIKYFGKKFIMKRVLIDEN